MPFQREFSIECRVAIDGFNYWIASADQVEVCVGHVSNRNDRWFDIGKPLAARDSAFQISVNPTKYIHFNSGHNNWQIIL